MKTIAFLLLTVCAALAQVNAPRVPPATSTGANGSTDAGSVAEFNSYGYLRAKRFLIGSDTGGTLSTENAFSDSRNIAILSVGATFTAATDIVTCASAHGRQAGDGVVFTNSGGALPSGIVSGTVYYVRSAPSTTTLTLTSSPGGSLLDVTGAGTGTHTIWSSAPHSFADERTFTGPVSGANSWEAANSFDAIPNIGSIADTGTFNHFAGYQCRPKYKQNTSIGYGFVSAPELFAGSARHTLVSTYRHLAVQDLIENTNGGFVSNCTTQYGLHIYALAAADNNVSIQSDGASARMIHNGRVALGTSSYSGIDANSHFHVLPQANMRGLYVSGYSLTSSNAYAAAELSGTWNTSGTPSLIKANVTDTASNAASLLLQLQVGSADKLTVKKDGTVFLANVSSAPGTPTGGVVIYAEGGALKAKGSSGTVTTIAAP